MNKIKESIKTIDDQNEKGYNAIAPSFNDQERVTTSNFHELSINFFESSMAYYIKDNMKVLEVGPGRNWLRENIRWKDINYTCADISERMLSMNNESNKIICSISSMPFRTEEFDCVISSLGDPFFYKEAIEEIYRVIKKKGCFIMTTPAYEWAFALRKNNNKTIFVSENNEKCETYTFTYNRIDMIDLWKECGFKPITIQSFYGAGLEKNISKDIINLEDDYRYLEIVTGAVFQK